MRIKFEGHCHFINIFYQMKKNNLIWPWVWHLYSNVILKFWVRSTYLIDVSHQLLWLYFFFFNCKETSIQAGVCESVGVAFCTKMIQCSQAWQGRALRGFAFPTQVPHRRRPPCKFWFDAYGCTYAKMKPLCTLTGRKRDFLGSINTCLCDAWLTDFIAFTHECSNGLLGLVSWDSYRRKRSRRTK